MRKRRRAAADLPGLAAAERAAKAMLSYDYRQLPTDRQRASGYLTAKYKKDYLKTFALLEKNKDGEYVVDGNIYVDMLQHIYITEKG